MSKKDANKRVDELLKLTHLSNKRDRQYGKCSGGEKRKTDIIRALVHNPSFLILDEPTTGLDADSREEIRSEEHTSELQSRGHLVCRLLLEKKKTTGRRPLPTVV